MGFVASFTHPKSPLWQGPQRHHHTIFLAKTVLLLIFILLIISHDAAFKYGFNDRGNDPRYQYFAKDWFFRVGLAVIPDGIYTFFTLVAVPLSASIPKLLHPILALCSSLAMIGLYATISFLHAIIIYGDESNNYEKAKWDSVGYAEVGFQAVLGLCYIGMAVLSCIAVHQWRRSKKDKKDHHAMDVELTPSTKESRTSEAI